MIGNTGDRTHIHTHRQWYSRHHLALSTVHTHTHGITQRLDILAAAVEAAAEEAHKGLEGRASASVLCSQLLSECLAFLQQTVTSGGRALGGGERSASSAAGASAAASGGGGGAAAGSSASSSRRGPRRQQQPYAALRRHEDEEEYEDEDRVIDVV